MYTERALSCHTRNRFMLSNLACPISRLRVGWDYTTVQRLHYRQTRSHGTEGWKDGFEDNKWMIVQCATFSKSLHPRNIDKSVSDIRVRIRFQFESSFWISVSGCKLTILPDIQPANRIVNISASGIGGRSHFFRLRLHPVPKFLNQGQDPGLAIFQIWGSDSCSDSGYNHRSNRNFPMFFLRNGRTDSCSCRNGKVTLVSGPVFLKFFTPGPDPKEKRRILPESTPVIRAGPASDLWCIRVRAMHQNNYKAVLPV